MIKLHKATLILVFSFLLAIICSSVLFAQETLTKYNTSWATVLPGTVICEPQETSYGFCLATDARTATGFSKTGTELWHSPIGRSRNISLTVLKDDFILLHEKNDNILKLLNPSGTELWHNSLSFVPREKPFIGRDGRFFLCSENQIICYGINGKIRWQMETSQQKNIPLQELPDGTLIVFLNDKEGKTQGIRFSPFGKQLEHITFAGSITMAWSCNSGILLTFNDGSAGLFSVEDDKAKNKWVIPSKNTNSIFTVSVDKTAFLYLTFGQNSIFVNHLSSFDGSIQSTYELKGFQKAQLQKIYFNDTGLFLCDRQNAFLYMDGKELWSARMPQTNQQDYNYLINLKDNTFIFCNKDWSMNAFKMADKTAAAPQKNSAAGKKNSYSNLISKDPSLEFALEYQKQFGSEFVDESITEKIKNNAYSGDECEVIAPVINICAIYTSKLSTNSFGARSEPSIFELDRPGFEKILYQLSFICTDDSQNLAASIIKKSQKNDCRYLISCLQGYDPDGLLLESLEIKSGLINHKDFGSLTAICDAVYEICRFMGRPAYNTRGKLIIKNFMSANYDSSSRNYARETLQKILSLNL